MRPRAALYYMVSTLRAGNVRRRMTALEESQYWSSDRLRDHQRDRLEALLEQARRRVPFYRDRLPRRAWSIGEGAEVCPFLTKRDLQRHTRELQAAGVKVGVVSKTTGGSTGQPVTVWKTRPAWAWELAATWRGYQWAGIGIGEKQARFWGVPHGRKDRWRARTIDFVCNRIRLSAFDVAPERMAEVWQRILSAHPVYFYGYVSILREFARYVEEDAVRDGLKLKCVITTSEVLTEPTRALLAEAFGTRVFNEYGCGELGTIAHECEHGSLHLSEENMLVEIFDGDRPCPPGQQGEIVVTELNNVAFPLIRYRTGDLGTISPEACPCGRSLRVLQHVHGRAYDIITNSQGRQIHPEAVMYIFEECHRRLGGIRQFQVEQSSATSYQVRVVADTGWSDEQMRWLEGRFRAVIDPEATLSFILVPRIQRTPSGKMRVVIGMPDQHQGVGDAR